MKLLNGKLVSGMPVLRRLCGRGMKEVVLDKRDFETLMNVSDHELRDWVERLYVRFDSREEPT